MKITLWFTDMSELKSIAWVNNNRKKEALRNALRGFYSFFGGNLKETLFPACEGHIGLGAQLGASSE